MQRTENNLGIAVIEDLYALSQVAQILRCSRKTVYRLISSGRLRAVRWGRSYRFRREDVQEFVRTSLTRVPKRRWRTAPGAKSLITRGLVLISSP